MKVRSYESDPLKIRFNHRQYSGSNMYYAAVVPALDERVELDTIMEYIKSDRPETKIKTPNGMEIVRLPTNKFKLPVDKEKVLKNGIRSEEHTSELQSRPHLVCRLLLEKKKI